MCVWKSGHQLPARARVRSTIFPLFVRKKKDNQTTHGCIVAVSFILGPPGLQTYVFFPAKFWKLQSACAHVIPTWACLHNILHLIFNFLSSFMPFIIITIIMFSCWAFLVSWLGLWGRSLLLIAGVCKGVRRMKKISEIRAQAVTVHQT